MYAKICIGYTPVKPFADLTERGFVGTFVILPCRVGLDMEFLLWVVSGSCIQGGGFVAVLLELGDVSQVLLKSAAQHEGVEALAAAA